MKKERIFWGVVLILGAVFLIANKLGYLEGINVVSLLLTVGLVYMMLKSLINRSFAGVLFPLAFIGIIYDDQLGITAITPWTVLVAALLGSVGLSLIFHKGGKKPRIEVNFDSKEYEPGEIQDEGRFRTHTSFGESIKYINTEEFEYGECNTSFSGVKLFFDNAKMKNEKAILEVNSSFSGVQLYVPKEWRIDDQTRVTLGGVEEKNRASVEKTNTLVLTGNLMLSGIEIVYV